MNRKYVYLESARKVNVSSFRSVVTAFKFVKALVCASITFQTPGHKPKIYLTFFLLVTSPSRCEKRCVFRDESGVTSLARGMFLRTCRFEHQYNNEHNQTFGQQIISTMNLPLTTLLPQIDLEELIQALKQERAAIGVLSKVEQQEPSRVASDAVKETGGTLETEQDGVVGKEGKADKEEKPVFSCEEAKSFTDYLVESQQAFSLINVADIQHGENFLLNTCTSKSFGFE